MIKLAATILVRALIELALVLLVIGGVFTVLAYRTARRFATTSPDALDKLAGTLSTALGIAAGRARRAAELVEPDDEPYDDEEEIGEDERQPIAHDEWRNLVP